MCLLFIIVVMNCQPGVRFPKPSLSNYGCNLQCSNHSYTMTVFGKAPLCWFICPLEYMLSAGCTNTNLTASYVNGWWETEWWGWESLLKTRHLSWSSLVKISAINSEILLPQWDRTLAIFVQMVHGFLYFMVYMICYFALFISSAITCDWSADEGCILQITIYFLQFSNYCTRLPPLLN